jgi:GGDEF domain-containing protein
MAGIRKCTGLLVVVAVAGLAMVAWWSMLAAERGAVEARQVGARRVAVATALAVRTEQSAGGDVHSLIALAEKVDGQRLLVQDGSGRTLGGTLDSGAPRASVNVAGSDLVVSAEIESAKDLGVGRFSHVITAIAFLVMAGSVAMLAIVARDRRSARSELDRLEVRWISAAAADELTGLGNRTRLIQDTQALVARGSRYGNAFALALFEVTDDPSDTTIKAVADLLSAEARDADLCYRVGADRFVAVLPEQDEVGAALAADRIRHSLHDKLGVDVITGRAAFMPWLPCTASALLLRAELDLGVTALVTEPTLETVPPAELSVTPRP